MKRSRRLIALLGLLAILVSTFTACSKSGDEIALSVGNADVGQDVYAYFLDKVLQNKGEDFKQEDAQKQAEDLCAEYVKVNSEFKKLGLSVSASSKAEVAQDVNDIYAIYGGYYEKIGVTKQTLTNVLLSDAYKDVIVKAIFGEGGEKAISADAQKAYFNENFVFFKAISAYLYTTDDNGNSVKISAEELATVKEKFESLKSQINAETTIDAVNLAYVTEAGGQTEAEMDVLSAQKGSEDYPEKFFSDVAALQDKEDKVLEYDNYIFLVQKVNSESYYKDNASDCLTSMVADEFSKELDSRYKDVKVKSEKGVQSSTYKTILRVKSANK